MNAFISSKQLNPAFVLTYLQTYTERLESDFDRFKHCPSQIVQVVASILHAVQLTWNEMMGQMYKNIQEESFFPQFKAMATDMYDLEVYIDGQFDALLSVVGIRSTGESFLRR